jgi:hypothetical protein
MPPPAQEERAGTGHRGAAGAGRGRAGANVPPLSGTVRCYSQSTSVSTVSFCKQEGRGGQVPQPCEARRPAAQRRRSQWHSQFRSRTTGPVHTCSRYIGCSGSRSCVCSPARGGQGCRQRRRPRRPGGGPGGRRPAARTWPGPHALQCGPPQSIHVSRPSRTKLAQLPTLRVSPTLSSAPAALSSARGRPAPGSRGFHRSLREMAVGDGTARCAPHRYPGTDLAPGSRAGRCPELPAGSEWQSGHPVAGEACYAGQRVAKRSPSRRGGMLRWAAAQRNKSRPDPLSTGIRSSISRPTRWVAALAWQARAISNSRGREWTAWGACLSTEGTRARQVTSTPR